MLGVYPAKKKHKVRAALLSMDSVPEIRIFDKRKLGSFQGKDGMCPINDLLSFIDSIDLNSKSFSELALFFQSLFMN